MAYNVYTVESLGNGDRNHIAFYIETKPHGRSTINPRAHISCHGHHPGSKKQVATIAPENLERFEKVCCLMVPPPKPQVTLSSKSLVPGAPLYRCAEWLRDVEKLAVEKGIFTRVAGSI
ncbi:hypothetical protein N7532_005066 [Penicillium argentinense]|uniref:Uncharacterized protein n=1 Tax=Penicillium argentinense TaxID=1131581 RepID=A0A9W9FDG3_9EURO|nr:uncharacterized protein N7532_005066 [Penicillium argentinense]KAJ5098065.1 hypothetical protein N7532_005066 [Penicillium argentinense]